MSNEQFIVLRRLGAGCVDMEVHSVHILIDGEVSEESGEPEPHVRGKAQEWFGSVSCFPKSDDEIIRLAGNHFGEGLQVCAVQPRVAGSSARCCV